MKVSRPLSVQVSLWLLLNLALLAAFGLGFFVIRGGIGWDALLAGPTGDLIINRHNAIALELGAAAPEDRDGILARAAQRFDAEYSLVRLDGETVAGPAGDLPAAVRERLDFARTTGRGREFAPHRGPPPGDGFGPARRHEPPDTPRGPPDPTREREGLRFLVRDGPPDGFWIGTRTGLAQRERRPSPAMLVARVESLWGLLAYLELQSWILGAAGAVGLSIAFWLPLVGSITRALGRLTRATEQIADGRFDTRVPTARHDEIGQLGDSVNRMAARLDAHMTGQKRFLADVAHELCSPLARLQLAAGILAERAPADLGETVADVRDEVQQMSTLVNELLAFTKSGLTPREVALVDVELAPLVQKVLEREDGTARVTEQVAPALRVRGDAALLDRALGNLVRNALRYAGADAAITLTAAPDGDRVTVAVQDDGPGVPPEALDRLGEPFFRPENARTRESGGVGLGLSIVRSAVATCGGDVRFSNRTPHGFRAEVRLAAAS